MEENKNEVAASAPEVTILSDKHSRAVTLDRSIKVHAQIAQQSLYEVCKGLKEMRDGKLYQELGYQNFADYCENEVGIKRSQAYNYISVAEKLSENFVQSTGQIGVNKLALLVKLDEPEREQLRQEIDVESTSEKQLQKRIKELKRQHSLELDEQKNQYEKQLQELEQERENLSVKFHFDRQAHQREQEEAKRKSESLAEHIMELENQIQELEERPIEVMQSTAELEEIERLKSELQVARSREQEAKAEVEKIQNASAETVAESEKCIEELQAKIAELESQPSTSGAEPDAKELFRPYFQACTHSIGLMMDFISKQRNSSNFVFLTSKASQIAEVIESQLQALKNQ
ncbi:MAG: hypothetical protein K2O42_07870 [Oscillospiraceae bacterium]|nr:hypothetical protein [Oscillospiraceae bacterium]